MNNAYFSLNTHTVRSINKSILDIDSYIDKAKSLNLKALSITNYNSLSDSYSFYKKCKANNIKPIIGCEFLVDNIKTNEIDHLVLIAVNKSGFNNLLYIYNNLYHNNSFNCNVTNMDIVKTHSKGIVALSSCVNGSLSKLIFKSVVQANNTEIIKMIKMYASIFDDFYLELEPGISNKQIELNSSLIFLSELTGAKLIVTNNVKYLNKEDYYAYMTHIYAANNKKIEDAYLKDNCHYVMNNNDIYNALSYIDRGIIDNCIDNINSLSSRVSDYKLLSDKILMPNINVPSGYNDADSYLEHLCFEKLNNIENDLDDSSIYVDRLYYELDVISALNFSDYFLIVWDYVSFAHKNNIPTGPGRGSSCSSLVAYLLDITKINPIKYNLPFERFLSIHRLKIPDIDVDVSAEYKDKLVEYIVNKYGYDYCSFISTYGTRKSKSAIKDTGKTLGINKNIYEYISSLIPSTYYIDKEDGNKEKLTDISISEALKLVPKLNNYYNKYPLLFNIAEKLVNKPKLVSIHSAGILISPVKLHDFIPIIEKSHKLLTSSSIGLDDAEYAGLIKFDLLSLLKLDVIKHINDMVGIKDIYSCLDNFNDKNVWNLISSKYLAGLFQISSKLYKERMYRIKPKSIEELAACLALIRGPCISSKSDEHYMRILEGKDKVEYIHPVYDEATKDTLGVLLFQEQLMKICTNIGFTLEESYIIMKLSANKDNKSLEKYKNKFMKLAEEKNIKVSIANKIFKIIKDTGLYCFNKSHATAYAVLCYITAYLKFYYTKEFYIANLTSMYENKKNTSSLIQEVKKSGYKFLPLDINKSKWEFTNENNEYIRIGFCAVKTLSKKDYDEFNKCRNISSFDDVINCNIKSVINSILLGAFNSIYDNKESAYEEYFRTANIPIETEYKIQGINRTIDYKDKISNIESLFYGDILYDNQMIAR